MPRLAYLAVADARGPLMRANLLSRLLHEDGVQVDVLTTSEAGQRFLAAMGTPSRTFIRPGPDLRRLAVYVTRPVRAFDELAALDRLAEGAKLVVNDGLHPALLAASALGRPFRVLQVAGENRWANAARLFDDRSGPVREAYQASLARAREGAFGCIIETLGEPTISPGARNWQLPPVVAEPKRAPRQMRKRLGAPLAVVYLSSHYRDPRIAANVEAAVARRGLAMFGVSEAFAGRCGWVAHEPELADAIAAADVFIAGAGMASLEQAHAYGTPFVALLGSQPEPAKNLARLAARGRTVRWAQIGEQTERSLGQALADIPLKADFEDPRVRIRSVQAVWRDAFRTLLSWDDPTGRAVRRRAACPPRTEQRP
jgi:hypothetical protein